MSLTIYHIYKITNIINGKCYIGFTNNLARRWKSHKSRYVKYNDNPKLTNAFKKYGLENFIFESIYESLDLEHALYEMEPHFIKKFDSIENGYNISLGGEGCYLTLEGKEKRRLLLRKRGYNPPMMGKTHTKETRNLISLATQAMWENNPGYREEMSKRHRGKKLSKETRQKMREAHQSPNTPLLDDKEWLFEQHIVLKKSIKTISKELKIPQQKISLALRKHNIPRKKYFKPSINRKWTEKRRKEFSQKNLGNKFNLGKKHSNETLEKLRKANCKYFYEIIFPNGYTVTVISLTEFSKKHNLRRMSLSHVVNTEYSYKGFKIKKFPILL